MKPEAQRIAIAEVCPSAYFDEGPREWLWRSGPMAGQRFDPLNDLNAIHVAEKGLLFSKRKRFRGVLQVVMSKNIGPGALIAIEECIHATAAQRAEAFLRTKGLWVEDAP